MSEEKIYPVPESFAARAHINQARYQELYKRSVDDPEAFWAQQAEIFVDWYKPWDKVLEWDYHKGKISWFEGATLNVSYNCLDRHLDERGDQTAIIWEGDDPNEDKRRTGRYMYFYGYSQRADSIPLTRSKQQRNLEELAKWVKRLSALPIGKLDESVLADAFVRTHSQAEVYRLEDIEQVFGETDKLEAATLAR